MSDLQKLVLMIQPTRLQGLIWQAVLKSQKLAVIWEMPDFDIEENLAQLEAAGLPLPNLLLIDVRIKNFNPYAFCRHCRDRYPDVKIVLTHSGQREIEGAERQWAMNQGAADFMAGFQRQNLVTTVTDRIQRVLQILDDHPFKHRALIAVLFSMKRELEAMDGQPVAWTMPNAADPSSAALPDPGQAAPAASAAAPDLADPPTNAAVEATPDQADPTLDPDASNPKAKRRYRGRKY